MRGVYRIRYGRAARQALKEEAAYIKEQSGADRSLSWLHEIQDSIQKLETSPRAFPVFSARKGRPIRSKVVMSHRAFYVVDEAVHEVIVIDIVHTARETRLAKYREDI